MFDVEEIAELGEESGREEAGDGVPFLPRVSQMDEAAYRAFRRRLTRRGRGRAQGLYALRGKAARVFAHNWACGYAANCDLFEQDGYLDQPYEVEEAREALVVAIEARCR